MIRVERERAVELAHHGAELEDRGDAFAVDSQKLAEIAEDGKVRGRTFIVERHGLFTERLSALVMLNPLGAGRSDLTLLAFLHGLGGDRVGAFGGVPRRRAREQQRDHDGERA